MFSYEKCLQQVVVFTWLNMFILSMITSETTALWDSFELSQKN